ncbi:MAG: hypothetical protein J3K34DRAFT_8010 [Monoraphidium minutum]|nr:MAG: hypothetical protein J3K34DRAFT_8010 [Monoraphidium minutum]
MAHAAVRQMWAQWIAADPANARDWAHGLPVDVLATCVGHLIAEPRALAAARGACAAWRGAADACLHELALRRWPEEPSALARFVGVRRLALKGPHLATDAARAERVGALLASAARLPRLESLEVAYPGPGALEELAALSGLTSLSLCRSHDAGATASPTSLPAAAAAAIAPPPPLPGVPLDAAGAGGGGEEWDARPGGGARLPAAVGELRRLHTLRLDNLPPSYDVLAPLPGLRRLEMRGQTLRLRNGLLMAANPLPGVGALTGLSALVARCNYGINRLPSEVGDLGALELLDVSKNMLWNLDDAIAPLRRLQHLDVSSNCLTALPDDLPLGLTHLDASNNSRVVLPESLSRLGALQALHLNWVWSDLGPVFRGGRGLSGLVTLRAIGNGITELPPSIREFKALRVLELSMNNLSFLPPAIGDLPALTHLDLSDNRLADLPQEISGLTALEVLGLRSNSLLALPEEAGGLGALLSLDVSMNHLEALPASITRLGALQQLAVSMNPLMSLPPGLAALSRLRVLEMYYVRLPGGCQGGGGGDGGASGGGGEGGDGARRSSGGGGGQGSDGAAAAAACRHLQELIPGLFVFSNAAAPPPPGGEGGDGGGVRGAAALPMGLEEGDLEYGLDHPAAAAAHDGAGGAAGGDDDDDTAAGAHADQAGPSVHVEYRRAARRATRYDD